MNLQPEVWGRSLALIRACTTHVFLLIILNMTLTKVPWDRRYFSWVAFVERGTLLSSSVALSSALPGLLEYCKRNSPSE